MQKGDGRKIQRGTLEYLRKRAILLLKEGKKIKDIADEFGLSLTAVYNWKNTYQKEGMSGLKQRKAPGAKPKLSDLEKKKLLKFLKKNADAYGFENPLWDCKKVQQLIFEKFKKKLHISNIWRFLQKSNLSSQKPSYEATQKDKKAIRKWIKEQWPMILAHARRWQAIIYFLDESAVQLFAFLGKTWSKKGVTPKIKMTGNKGSIIITSAISSSGRFVFRLEKEKITVKAPQHIEFLKQIQRRHKHRKIIVIEDNASPHIAGKVRDFVNSQKKRLAVYYLPSYAPELNPDEHVWAYLKSVKLKAHQTKTLKEFRPLVFSKMKSMQMNTPLVSSFFYGPLFK